MGECKYAAFEWQMFISWKGRLAEPFSTLKAIHFFVMHFLRKHCVFAGRPSVGFRRRPVARRGRRQEAGGRREGLPGNRGLIGADRGTASV